MEYPKVKYGKAVDSGALVTHTVHSQPEEDDLPAGWVDNPSELGIETHPSSKVPVVEEIVAVEPPPGPEEIPPPEADATDAEKAEYERKVELRKEAIAKHEKAEKEKADRIAAKKAVEPQPVPGVPPKTPPRKKGW